MFSVCSVHTKIISVDLALLLSERKSKVSFSTQDFEKHLIESFYSLCSLICPLEQRNCIGRDGESSWLQWTVFVCFSVRPAVCCIYLPDNRLLCLEKSADLGPGWLHPISRIWHHTQSYSIKGRKLVFVVVVVWYCLTTHTHTHTLDLISASAQSKVPAYLSFPLTVILPGHFTLLQHPLSSLISLCLSPSTLPPLMHLDEGFFHTRHSRNLNLFY